MTTTVIDHTPLFIGCRFIDKTVTVAGNTPLVTGTVLGELTATGKLVPFVHTASDGSQIPEYVLAQDLVNSTANPVDKTFVRVCEAGQVNASKLQYAMASLNSLSVTNQLATVVSNKGSIETLLKNIGIYAEKSLDVVS